MTPPTPPAPALLDRVRALSPHRRAALAALAGAVLLLLAGLALPWIGGAEADLVSYGRQPSGEGYDLLGSRAGRRGGDGLLLAAIGLAVAVAAVPSLFDRSFPRQRAVLLGGGLLALAWSVLDITEVGQIPAADGTPLDIGPSIGGFVAVLGALLPVAAGMLTPRDRLADRARREALAHRLADRGRTAAAAEILQRLVVSSTDADGAPAVLWRLRLGRVYAEAGLLHQADQAVGDAVAAAERVLADDSEESHLLRVLAARLVAEHDMPGALGRLDELRREAHTGPTHERADDAERVRAGPLALHRDDRTRTGGERR
ncbi:hypothetical protein NI17_011375 [Thermobifida halotolerans]|uniref:Uncharacterized protein n=1 Tax=Thermobifida halotolerans TaxID=483545 RepID=A0A399G6G1_9ACTN|nr:hypothetical protein [Thermobifida halotolerans]UOE21640.1 hypothetical protein NI17_011375 [Thermobifida halotolerans]